MEWYGVPWTFLNQRKGVVSVCWERMGREDGKIGARWVDDSIPLELDAILPAQCAGQLNPRATIVVRKPLLIEGRA